MRIAHPDRILNTLPSGGLVVYLNHPSWWDPLAGFVLARHLFPGRNFYAPMDGVALERYGLLQRLGMFPVELGTPRGAAQFLRSAEAVLDAGHILAVTPQGHFTDARVRPVNLRPGLATLLRRRTKQGRSTTVVPLALEYTFWDQRLPEILVNCGAPLWLPGGPTESAPDPQVALEAAMTRAQDELAQLAMARDPAQFAVVLQGGQGSSGFYGLLERVRAALGRNAERGDHRS